MYVYEYAYIYIYIYIYTHAYVLYMYVHIHIHHSCTFRERERPISVNTHHMIHTDVHVYIYIYIYIYTCIHICIHTYIGHGWTQVGLRRLQAVTPSPARALELRAVSDVATPRYGGAQSTVSREPSMGSPQVVVCLK